MPSTLGFCAGAKLDLLPAKNERELEHRDFPMSTIRCHINACRGRYAHEDNYREVFRHNIAKPAQDFFNDWE